MSSQLFLDDFTSLIRYDVGITDLRERKEVNGMFVMFEKEEFKVPVRVWLEGPGVLEESCLEQARHLAKLPFLHKWVCLMPDTHAGMGMPIGGGISAGVSFKQLPAHQTRPDVLFPLFPGKKKKMQEIEMYRGNKVR